MRQGLSAREHRQVVHLHSAEEFLRDGLRLTCEQHRIDRLGQRLPHRLLNSGLLSFIGGQRRAIELNDLLDLLQIRHCRDHLCRREQIAVGEVRLLRWTPKIGSSLQVLVSHYLLSLLLK